MDVHRVHRARTAGRFHVTANPSSSNALQYGNRSLTHHHILQIYTCVFTNVTRNKRTHSAGLRDNVTVVPDVPAALPFKSSCGTPLKCHSRFETKSQKQRCFKSRPPPKKMFGVACENLGLQWHVIYDSWIVLINLWISVRVGFLLLCFPLPADVNNMAQLACRDLSYCVSSVFYASTALSAGASLGTINPNKTTSPKCCVLPQLRWFSDHSKVNITAGDSK